METNQFVMLKMRGYCFLCLNPTSSFCKVESDAHLENLDVVTTPLPLQNIFQYLKLKLGELEKRVKQPELKGGALCEECSIISERFSETFLEFKVIQMKLRNFLSIIQSKMLEAENNNTVLENFKKEMQKSEDAAEQYKAMQQFRRRTLEQCARKLNKVIPLVTVHNMSAEQVEIEKVKVKILSKDTGVDPEPSYEFRHDPPDVDIENTNAEIKVEPDLEDAMQLSPETKHDFSNSLMELNEDTHSESESSHSPTSEQHRSYLFINFDTPNEMESTEEITTEHECPPIMITPSNFPNLDGRPLYTKGQNIGRARGRYICSLCPKQFRGIKKFNIHYEAIHQKVKYKCTICEKDFTYKTSYYMHYNNVHVGLKLKCKKCSKTFANKSNLRRHQSTCEGPDPSEGHECPQCKQRFETKPRLRTHHRMVHSKNIMKPKKKKVEHADPDLRPVFKCNLCEYECRERGSYFRHKRVKHKGVKYECPKCGKKFADKGVLKRHQISTTCGSGSSSEMPKHKCQICEKEFSLSGSLRQHVRLVHEKARDHLCSQCGKGFGTAHYLRIHVNTVHSEGRDHLCDLCGKRFRWKIVWKSHRQKVHGVVE